MGPPQYSHQPYYPPPSPHYVGTPPVLLWERVYCGFMALLYVLCAVGGVAAVVFRNQLADRENPAEFWLFFGIMFGGMGAVLALAYLASFFLPRRPWAWIYHIFMIGIGLTSGCTLVAALPLLIYWIKPETKAYFEQPPA